MKTLFIVLVVMSSFFLPQSLFAQGDADCDPDAVLDWLIRRQAWRNATTDLWDLPEWTSETALRFHEHLEQIAALERPACADAVMLWTYDYYDAMSRYFLCLRYEPDSNCLERMDAAGERYGEQINLALDPLQALTGFTYDDYLDLRPEDLTDGPMATVAPPVAQPPAATPAALQDADLADIDSVDFDAIAARIPPPVDPARIEQVGDNGTGLPAFLSYTFEPQEIAPDVFVDHSVGWALSTTEIRASMRWDFRNEGSHSEPVNFIVDIPKEFAPSADEIYFSVPPTEIIDEDPVFRWLLSMDEGLVRRIEANSLVLMTLSHAENTITLLEGFQNQLKLINLRRQFQACGSMSGSAVDESICALTVILQNRYDIDMAICDSFGRVTVEGDRAVDVVFRNACRNLLQPYNNMHCDYNEEHLRNACLSLTRVVLSTSCAGLTGVERNLCLYDVAAYVGDARGCAIIEDADMVRDCRAALSADPAYCADIADAARREACCALFKADANQYELCMGDQTPAAGDEPVVTGETLTLDEVLGVDGEESSGAGESVSLPPAPDLGFLMSADFFAEYACEGEDDRLRYIAEDGQFFFSGDTDRTFPLPPNLVTTMREQGHEDFAMAAFFTMGAPGLWLPLDGSTYSLPAVTEPWATDNNSLDRFSALDLRPAPDTLTIAGTTVDAVRYEGSYTHEVVIDRRDSTFTDGYYSSAVSRTYRAWYDQRTGLLLKTEFRQEPIDCVREGDYADEDCPGALSATCILTATSLPLGR